MVDVKELRVGNWVKLNRSGIHFQVKAVDESYSEGECSAIPLTPEIFEKCGFLDSTFHNSWSIEINKSVYLHVYGSRRAAGLSESLEIADHDVDAPCKYLHQLQNLYYALTGTELNYKP